MVEILAEGDGDVLLLIAHRGEQGDERVGSTLACFLGQTELGQALDDGLAALPLIVGQFGIAEVGAQPGHVAAHLVMADARAREHYLGVGQDDGEAVAVLLHIPLGEIAEVYVCLHRGIHRNGDAALAEGQVDVNLFAQELALDADLVVVGDNLVDVTICRIEPRALLYAGDEHAHRVDSLGCRLRLPVCAGSKEGEKAHKKYQKPEFSHHLTAHLTI